MTQIDGGYEAIEYNHCDCGHSATRHRGTTGACNATTLCIDNSGLPEPIYSASLDADPFAWPINWPVPSDLPRINHPCSCTRFSEYEQLDYDDRPES